MQWVDRFDFFLFDFDGLLVDTERLHYQAYIHMCRERGYELEWSFPTYCSIAHLSPDGIKEQIYAAFPRLYEQEPSWQVLYQEKKEAYLSLLQTAKIPLMPGVKEILSTLQMKEKNHCVVTHSPMEQIAILRKIDPLLERIPHWVTREAYENPKPSPDGYLRAIELYGKKTKKIIGFEDTFRGLSSLVQTPALAILVCPKDHPQMKGELPETARHISSLEGISALFS